MHFFLYLQEGAVSVLLRLRHSAPRDELIQRQIREGLALLGYTDPLPARGIRILSIDGGGTRCRIKIYFSILFASFDFALVKLKGPAGTADPASHGGKSGPAHP